jgi:hypothetical protein
MSHTILVKKNTFYFYFLAFCNLLPQTIALKPLPLFLKEIFRNFLPKKLKWRIDAWYEKNEIFSLNFLNWMSLIDLINKFINYLVESIKVIIYCCLHVIRVLITVATLRRLIRISKNKKKLSRLETNLQWEKCERSFCKNLVNFYA